MTYEELKNYDIFNIDIDDIEEFQNEILISKTDDIIKYINYLNWLYYIKLTSFAKLKIVQKILSHQTIQRLMEENSHIAFGDVEDLESIPEETNEKVIKRKYTKILVKDNDKEYKLNVVAMLSDDFESIFICEKKDNLKVYGVIDNYGLLYIYELPDDNKDYLNAVINAEIGIKANIKSHMIGGKWIKKTFIKEEISVGDSYQMSKKSNEGIATVTIGGVFYTIKTENVLNFEEPIINFPKITTIPGSGILDISLDKESDKIVSEWNNND